MRYAAFTSLIALAVLVAVAWPSGTQAGLGGPFIENTSVVSGPAEASPDEITVQFKPGVPGFVQTRLTAAAGASLVDNGPRSRTLRVKAGDAAKVEELLTALRANPLVAEAGPSHNASIISRPDDPQYPYQWHVRSAEGGSWADTAWDMATNHGAGVTVAIIDTGVAYENHSGALGNYPQTFVQAPDLAGATFVAPWDFANNDAHANDDHGHGTHVAGTIAQSTNNGYGMAGVAYGATIMPVKALDYAGGGTDAGVIEAIYYAVDNGADVINMSLGFPGTGLPNASGDVCTEIVGLNAALQYAYDHDVVIVAAAGNDGGSQPLCPAAYPTVVSVAATRYDGGITSYSNTGADISAPGGEPGLDQNGDGYADGILQETFCYDGIIMLLLNRYGSFCNVFNAGTSMASPHVAGTAALLLGEAPALTVNQVRLLLFATARDNGAPGFDATFGWGNLDAAAAAASLLGVPVPQPTPMPGLAAPSSVIATAVSSSRIDVSWTDNATAETGYKLERSTDGVTFSLLASLAANRMTYSNTNLPASTTYSYRVRAVNGPDASAYGGPVAATTQPAPAAPAGLTAATLSSSKIQLGWTDNATNEAGFRLERSTDGVTFAQVTVLAANATTYTNGNLTAGTSYTYRIRAYEGSNYSAYSNTASATTQPTPAAPSSLTATAVSTSRVNLTWSDNSTNEYAFRLERSTDGVNFSLVSNIGANVTSYSNLNLSAATTYTYRVRAYDGPNYSAFSTAAAATTQPPPAGPTNLSATATSSSRINLTWTDNASNEAGFKIERSTDGVAYSVVTTVGVNATSYSVTNLTASTASWFRVRAYEGPNYSAYTNVAQETTQPAPAAPTGLSASSNAPRKITLAWTDNSTNEAGFKLERSTDGVTFTVVANVNTTSYTNSSLTSGTTYYYRVRAYDGPNYSGYTDIASATAK